MEWSQSSWVALLQSEIIKGRYGFNLKKGPDRKRLSEVKPPETLMGWTLGPEHRPLHYNGLLLFGQSLLMQTLFLCRGKEKEFSA